MDKFYFENEMVIDADRPDSELFRDHVTQNHPDLESIDRMLASIFSPSNFD